MARSAFGNPFFFNSRSHPHGNKRCLNVPSPTLPKVESNRSSVEGFCLPSLLLLQIPPLFSPPQAFSFIFSFPCVSPPLFCCFSSSFPLQNGGFISESFIPCCPVPLSFFFSLWEIVALGSLIFFFCPLHRIHSGSALRPQVVLVFRPQSVSRNPSCFPPPSVSFIHPPQAMVLRSSVYSFPSLVFSLPLSYLGVIPCPHKCQLCTWHFLCLTFPSLCVTCCYTTLHPPHGGPAYLQEFQVS